MALVPVKFGRRRFFGRLDGWNPRIRKWIQDVIPFPEHIALKIQDTWYEVCETHDKTLPITNDVRTNGVDSDFHDVIDLGSITIELPENQTVDDVVNTLINQWLQEFPKYNPLGVNCQSFIHDLESKLQTLDPQANLPPIETQHKTAVILGSAVSLILLGVGGFLISFLSLWSLFAILPLLTAIIPGGVAAIFAFNML